MVPPSLRRRRINENPAPSSLSAWLEMTTSADGTDSNLRRSSLRHSASGSHADPHRRTQRRTRQPRHSRPAGRARPMWQLRPVRPSRAGIPRCSTERFAAPRLSRRKSRGIASPCRPRHETPTQLDRSRRRAEAVTLQHQHRCAPQIGEGRSGRVLIRGGTQFRGQLHAERNRAASRRSFSQPLPMLP